MKKIVKKLSAIALCTVFASMQVSASIMTGDTGLGVGNGGAVINSAQGGYLGTDLGKDSATLNFNGNSHVNWDSLNVNKGESLNFNAVDGANGLTVVNTVNSGMTKVYGSISSNQGVSKLIISNPNGMLFDGAKFTTAGDLQLTTQALAVNYLNGNLDIQGINQAATNGIVIKDGDGVKSEFNIGGEFNIVAPSVELIGGYIGATKGLNLITKDGQNFLICPNTSNDYTHTAVRLKAVEIDGDVYVLSGEDIVTIIEGGKIAGDLNIDSKGNVGINYNNNGKVFEVTGNVTSNADGQANLIRKAKVGGDLKMSNTGGYVEIGTVNVAGNVDLKTTTGSNDNQKHFIHVVGYNDIDGNLNVDSIHNIHIGGYDDNLKDLLPGHLNVGGDINAVAHDGSVAVTVDTTANKVALTSDTLNIVTDGKALITANEYEFAAKQYIGGLEDKNYLINTVMEKYTPIGRYIVGDKGYVNIAGGNVTKFEQDNTSYAFLKSNDNMNIDNINAGKVYLTSDKDIVIKDNAVADTIKVGGETRNLTVKLPNRDYTLKYTNIRDSQVITIDGNTEITYDMANGENGWNKGTQTAMNTYLVVPGSPVVPPVEPDSDPEDPTKDEAEKILKNLNRDEVSSAIDAQQVMTPVAFAADLDEEIETGVRKNVDGSVTVVRPFTPTK
ncbi:filamentous hemagglutinin N-terminal domain-containing protein [bacterium]|nr:filamentous hemagglutinin N-terminal domain-containing protein [bacterium]